MKIAILSDTHDNWSNFKKAIDFLNTEKIEVMLHCGDVCNQETINEATKNFKGTIHFVKGNGDFELDIPETMELELGAKKIFFNHYPDVAKKAGETGKYDLVCHGHTHTPWVEQLVCIDGDERKEYLLMNPGELAGQRFKPTFAIYDTESNKLELKILETI